NAFAQEDNTMNTSEPIEGVQLHDLNQFGSQHSGGSIANFAFADGSVKAIAKSINIIVFQRLSTRAGGEGGGAGAYQGPAGGMGVVGWRGAVALRAFAGWGRSRKVEFAEVEGKVTLGDKPLSGAIVTFYPDDEGAEQLPYARGTTDARGAYTLTAVTGQPGAM